MWQLLAKPLLGVVADGVKGFVETKKAKQELKLTTIKATQKLKEDQIAGKVAWEQSAVDQMKGSWKDEVALIVLLLPAVLARSCTSRIYRLARPTGILSQFIIHCDIG
jgi:hypothetical protein